MKHSSVLFWGSNPQKVLRHLHQDTVRMQKMLKWYKCGTKRCWTFIRWTPDNVFNGLTGNVYLRCHKCGQLTLIEDRSLEYIDMINNKGDVL